MKLNCFSKRNFRRDRSINDMEEMFDDELEKLTAHKKPNKTKLEQAGFSFTQQSLNNGARLYYFPVLAIGHGVIGDQVYGKVKNEWGNIKRQMLHAWELELTHPKSGKRMTFKSPIPQDMRDAIEMMR